MSGGGFYCVLSNHLVHENTIESLHSALRPAYKSASVITFARLVIKITRKDHVNHLDDTFEHFSSADFAPIQILQWVQHLRLTAAFYHDENWSCTMVEPWGRMRDSEYISDVGRRVLRVLEQLKPHTLQSFQWVGFLVVQPETP